jgi:hypothetical protein
MRFHTQYLASAAKTAVDTLAGSWDNRIGRWSVSRLGPARTLALSSATVLMPVRSKYTRSILKYFPKSAIEYVGGDPASQWHLLA